MSRRTSLIVALSAACLGGCLGSAKIHPAQRAKILSTFSREAEAPTDRGNAVADDARAAQLGRFLFWFDGFTVTDAEDAERIQATACVTCHDPAKTLTDGLPVAEGALSGHRAVRGSPSLYHAANRHFLFWDGRADSLWSQALKPIEDPVEMASNRLRVAHVVAGQPELRQAYEAVFGPLPDLSDRDRFPLDGLPPTHGSGTCDTHLDCLTDAGERCVGGLCTDAREFSDQTRRKLSRWRGAWLSMKKADRATIDGVFANVGKALAAFERQLVLEDSPFDRYLAALERRDAAAMDAALTPLQQAGLEAFMKTHGGCAKCHDGPDLTDELFHNVQLETSSDHRAETEDAAPLLQRSGGAARLVDDPFNCAGPHATKCSPAAVARLESASRDVASPRALGQVRTPSLRNVMKTAPYMHAGQHRDMQEALQFYVDLPQVPDAVGKRNRFVDLIRLDLLSKTDPDDVEAIEAFLHALSSEAACPLVLERPTSPVGELRCP